MDEVLYTEILSYLQFEQNYGLRYSDTINGSDGRWKPREEILRLMSGAVGFLITPKLPHVLQLGLRL